MQVLVRMEDVSANILGFLPVGKGAIDRSFSLHPDVNCCKFGCVAECRVWYLDDEVVDWSGLPIGMSDARVAEREAARF